MPPLSGKRILLTGGSGFIGTNLIDLLTTAGAKVTNADVGRPLRDTHRSAWRKCDVAVESEIASLIADVDPHMVLHLAARTDTTSTNPDDYALNYLGTANVRCALEEASSVERFVFVSTQFVLGPGVPFQSERQYSPHTAYGVSKARAEEALRSDPPSVTWTIVRPTNVWGPWHLRYQREFWHILERGLYVHPSTPDPIRSYGYVGSVCLQLLRVLASEESAVSGRVLYVGDMPIHLSQWVDAFSVAIRGKRARRVPGAALSAFARVGDLARRAAVTLPLDSSRYRSMTEDYPTPMQATALALDCFPAVPLTTGVAETMSWLREGRCAD